MPALLGLAAPLLAGEAGPVEQEPLEEVRVEDLPGPMMWRVSRDDHELWIIGTVSPVPISLEWNRGEIETVVREADEIIGGVGMTVGLGMRNSFALLRALPSLINVHKNKDKAKLVDLLPPEQYARWQALEVAALGKPPENDIEQWRPMIIADALYAKSLKAHGLSESSPAEAVMSATAREAGVPTQSRNYGFSLSGPRKLAAEFRSLPRDRELECLVATMDFIEQKLPKIEELGRLWAVGDARLLEADLSPLEREPCTLQSVRDSSLKDTIGRVESGTRQYFLDMAGYALLSRDTVVATLPLKMLTGPDSVLEELRTNGYTVELPH